MPANIGTERVRGRTEGAWQGGEAPGTREENLWTVDTVDSVCVGAKRRDGEAEAAVCRREWKPQEQTQLP